MLQFKEKLIMVSAGGGISYFLVGCLYALTSIIFSFFYSLHGLTLTLNRFCAQGSIWKRACKISRWIQRGWRSWRHNLIQGWHFAVRGSVSHHRKIHSVGPDEHNLFLTYGTHKSKNTMGVFARPSTEEYWSWNPVLQEIPICYTQTLTNKCLIVYQIYSITRWFFFASMSETKLLFHSHVHRLHLLFDPLHAVAEATTRRRSVR